MIGLSRVVKHQTKWFTGSMSQQGFSTLLNKYHFLQKWLCRYHGHQRGLLCAGTGSVAWIVPALRKRHAGMGCCTVTQSHWCTAALTICTLGKVGSGSVVWSLTCRIYTTGACLEETKWWVGLLQSG